MWHSGNLEGFIDIIGTRAEACDVLVSLVLWRRKLIRSPFCAGGATFRSLDTVPAWEITVWDFARGSLESWETHFSPMDNGKQHLNNFSFRFLCLKITVFCKVRQCFGSSIGDIFGWGDAVTGSIDPFSLGEKRLPMAAYWIWQDWDMVLSMQAESHIESCYVRCDSKWRVFHCEEQATGSLHTEEQVSQISLNKSSCQWRVRSLALQH